MSLAGRVASLCIVLACSAGAFAARPGPDVLKKARVKPNVNRMTHANEGGELTKLILKWKSVSGAKSYEICRNCDIDDETHTRTGDAGKVGAATLEDTCGDDPCYIDPMIPVASYTYHVRAALSGGKFTLWSETRRYDLSKVHNAMATHEEVEIDYQKELTALYQKHNPAKLGKVDALLKKYKGKEGQLLKTVREKYNEVEDIGKEAEAAKAAKAAKAAAGGGTDPAVDMKTKGPTCLKQARVKPNVNRHSHKNEGGDLTKLILKWYPATGATGYEVCRNCEIDTKTQRRADKDGVLAATTLEDTCGDEPCHVDSMIPKQVHTYHVRTKLSGGKFSQWSDLMRFDTRKVENAMAKHEEAGADAQAGATVEEVVLQDDEEDVPDVDAGAVGVEKQLIDLYKKYNPEGLSKIPMLLKKYAGMEQEVRRFPRPD